MAISINFCAAFARSTGTSGPNAPRERKQSPPQGWPRPLRRPSQCSTGGLLRQSGPNVWSGFRLDMCEGAWQRPPLATSNHSSWPRQPGDKGSPPGQQSFSRFARILAVCGAPPPAATGRRAGSLHEMTAEGAPGSGWTCLGRRRLLVGLVSMEAATHGNDGSAGHIIRCSIGLEY